MKFTGKSGASDVVFRCPDAATDGAEEKSEFVTKKVTLGD